MDHVAECNRLRQELASAEARIATLREREEVLGSTLRLLLGWLKEEHLEVWKHEHVRRSYNVFLAQSMAQFNGEVPPPEDRSVTELGLGLRAENMLDEWKVVYVTELLVKTQEWLLRIPNFGRGTLAKVHTALRREGYLGWDQELPTEKEIQT